MNWQKSDLTIMADVPSGFLPSVKILPISMKQLSMKLLTKCI